MATKKKDSGKIIYSEPKGYMPKDILNDLFKDQKKNTTKKPANKKPTSKKK